MNTLTDMTYAQRFKSADERFWEKVALGGPDDCWLWQATRTRLGYGQFKLDGKSVSVHRYAYETRVGPIPQGLELDHLCRTPLCVNPDHLQPVTHAENARRGLVGQNHRSKTHCPQGHPYAGDNLYVATNGGRVCRECRRAAQSRYYARRRHALR